MKTEKSTTKLSVERPTRRRSLKTKAILATIVNNFKAWLNIRLSDWMTLVFSSLDGESRGSWIVNQCFCRLPKRCDIDCRTLFEETDALTRSNQLFEQAGSKVRWTGSRSEPPSLRSNGLKRRHEQDTVHIYASNHRCRLGYHACIRSSHISCPEKRRACWMVVSLRFYSFKKNTRRHRVGSSAVQIRQLRSAVSYSTPWKQRSQFHWGKNRIAFWHNAWARTEALWWWSSEHIGRNNIQRRRIHEKRVARYNQDGARK